MKHIHNFLEHLNEQNDALKELGIKDGKIDLSKTTDKIKQDVFKQVLDNNDIEGDIIKIKAKDLEPSEKEIYLDQIISNLLKDHEFVEKALKGKIKDDKIIISSDNCVIDGHHKWASAFILNPNCKIKCTKINMTYDEAIPIFTEILKEFNTEDENVHDDYKYNIFDLIKMSRDKVKSAIIELFNQKPNEKKLLNEIDEKTDSDLHPLNYIISNIYKIPNPDHKLYDRKDSPQFNEVEIDEILNK